MYMILTENDEPLTYDYPDNDWKGGLVWTLYEFDNKNCDHNIFVLNSQDEFEEWISHVRCGHGIGSFRNPELAKHINPDGLKLKKFVDIQSWI